MKKVLVLGGTNFIGRNLLEKLNQQSELDICMFNRGETNPNLFKNIRQIKGDRLTNGVKQIFDEKWDFVVDLSCYFPAALQPILKGLNSSLSKYIFVSTCSVYDNESNQSIGRDETAKSLDCNADQKADTSTSSYGNRKAECERILIESGLEHCIFRPALVYGQYDNTDRLYYWLYQIKTERTLLFPGDGKGIFSMTYVMDLVEAITKAITKPEVKGIYNIVTKPKASLAEICETSSEILGKPMTIASCDVEFLHANKVAEWTDLPLWLDMDYFTYANKKSKNEMLMEYSSFDNSLQKTIEYYESLNWPEPKYGMDDQWKEELLSGEFN